MNQNKNTPFNIECSVIGEQQTTGGFSIFNFQQGFDKVIQQNRINMRESFSAFVNSRNKYLSTLPSLGNNWISGIAKQPTDKSVSVSKQILNDIWNWYTNKGFEDFVYPKIIMSPTPNGGVGMEIELYPKLRAYIAILDDKVTYEIEKNGYFEEKESNTEEISNQLLSLYNPDVVSSVIEFNTK